MRRRRALAVFVVASLALHVALFAGLPPFSIEPEAPEPTVLDVVLVSPAPAPPQRAEPPAPPPSPPAKKPAASKPPPREQAAAPRPKPIVPEPSAPAASRAPEPRPEPASPAPSSTAAEPAQRPAQPEPRPAVTASAPPSTASSASAPLPVTAPQFNAAYLRNPPPRYPVIARRRGEEGTVTLRVHVQRDGVPASVEVDKSSGSEALDIAALDAVRNWRFAPARRGEERIDAWVLVPIVFRLEGAS